MISYLHVLPMPEDKIRIVPATNPVTEWHMQVHFNDGGNLILSLSREQALHLAEKLSEEVHRQLEGTNA